MNVISRAQHRLDGENRKTRMSFGQILMIAGVLCTSGCGDSIGPAEPTQLLFLVEPATVGLGSPLAPTIVVAVTDQLGRVVTSWSDTVTLSIDAAGNAASLLGTTARAPVAGTALFDNIRIETVGADYALIAESGPFTATSSSFAIHDVFMSSQVTAGSYHVCALQSDGAAYCWGDNRYGQLGDGTQEDRSLPTPVTTSLRFESLSAGWYHTCGLAADGSAHCWGDNHHGQLGDGTTGSSHTPRPVAGGLQFTALDAGSDHNCAITHDGNAYCWGDNTFVQLGEATDTSRTVPTPVTGDIQFAAISAGYIQTCGLTDAGVAYCWGRNMYAEIGDDTREARATPTLVAGDLRFGSLIAGGGPCHGHTCGITTDGTTYCWGFNFQRDTNPSVWRIWHQVPVTLAGDPGFNSVSVGGRAVCGIDHEGALHCLGDGHDGQAGLGTTERVEMPTPLMTGHTFISVSSGQSHTCALTTVGTTYCWGSNNRGQLGNGSNPLGWSVPVPVWMP